MFGEWVVDNERNLSNILFLENDELALQEFQSNFQQPLVDNLLDLIEEHSRTTRSATEVAFENLLWVFNSSQHMFLCLVEFSGYRQMLAVGTDPNTSCCRMLVAYWHNIFTAFLLILIGCAFFKSKAMFEGFLGTIDLVFNGGKNHDWISPDISLSWDYMYYSQVTTAARAGVARRGRDLASPNYGTSSSAERSTFILQNLSRHPQNQHAGRRRLPSSSQRRDVRRVC